VPGVLGYLTPPPGYLEELREICHRHGGLLIFDEVQDLRLNEGGAQKMYGIDPDLTSMAKIIGGGFPVGAVGGRTEVMSVFDPRQGKPAVPHAGTFNANPMTMAAGLAAMRLMTPTSYDRLNELGDAARAHLTSVFEEEGFPAQVGGRGSLLMFHLHDHPITDYRSAYRSAEDKKAVSRLHNLLLNHGILIAPNGLCVLSTATGEVEVDRLAQAVRYAVREMSSVVDAGIGDA
ncbi:MAG: aminotransferase class III-fold pyridoxal phosphate-dependent enzyme, partial [Gemmatimonadetes bacterium]|nr:aminotransferase class III-fold pyridoxal phosphate-dependent enzyme [Gemmatimonadota bacterium]